MIISDNIYGIEKIDEKILLDLINSKPVQRLKKISQMGMPQEYYHFPVFSRYEHSVGVLVLLRRLNASLKEQIEGLLHDISHPTFSHVIDWVMGDPSKEDYQDNNYIKILINSEIPLILEKNNLNINDIKNLKNFSLLERDIPSLCADRLDYGIREFKYRLNPKLVDLCINNLTNVRGQISFKSKEIARLFAENYLKLQNEHWAGDEAKIRYHILANILRKALSEKIIFIEDFYKTEEEVIIKLKESFDFNILENLNLLRRKLKFREDKEGILLRKKFRYIDPEVLMEGEVKKLSEISEEYRQRLEMEKQGAKDEKRIIILK